jgi:cell wall-associated NlpC family hydrolase
VTGNAVAQDALQYLGVPYVWAHQDPTGWDCSGFVTYVLHHDFGIDLPDNTHTVTEQFYVWTGADTIPRDQCAAGDLVCWVSHIGIALDASTMVNAANPTDGTLISDIWTVPAPIIRRPQAYTTRNTSELAGKGAI